MNVFDGFLTYGPQLTAGQTNIIYDPITETLRIPHHQIQALQPFSQQAQKSYFSSSQP